MDRLFGTDGIRGRANQYPLTPEMLVRIGQGIAEFFKKESKDRILIANDGRISADLMECGLAAGICSKGMDAVFCGMLPTPGIAWLASSEKAAAAISVSASHNPFDDNGIKIFKENGFKLSQKEEKQLESLIFKGTASTTDKITEPAQVLHLSNSADRYKTFLASTFPTALKLTGMKIVLDCANGAVSQIAPQLLIDLEAEVITLSNAPNGKNINVKCGSEYPEQLRQQVIDSRADLGIAFDGDGDRVLIIDEKGEILSGDELLAIFAVNLFRENELKNQTVVSTVMSNIGLGLALKGWGINHLMADVGDRHVAEMMKKNGAILGGEDSGHMIFLDFHTTGDGILSALQLLRIIRTSGKSIHELKKIMTRFPQVLVNVAVRKKPPIDSIPVVWSAIASVENELAEKGRVLVRYSGTQNLCRVMVEGPDQGEIDNYARQISAAIKEAIGD